MKTKVTPGELGMIVGTLIGITLWALFIHYFWNYEKNRTPSERPAAHSNR